MAIDDLSKFKQTYIQECKELLADMEELLMGVGSGEGESETLNAIFRCAHSIKGGAGAFGLTRISEFTHVLESILDDMRNGKLAPSQEIVDVLLESKDWLAQMVDMAEKGEAIQKDLGKKTEDDLLKLAKGGLSNEAKAPVNTDSNSTSKAGEVICDQNKFLNISFVPHKDALITGNEPVMILKELAQMGDMTVNGSYESVPTFEELDPTSCYIKFNIGLDTTHPVAEVKSAFEFVEDLCDLKIEEEAGIFSEPVMQTQATNDNASEANKDNQAQESQEAQAAGPKRDDSAAANAIRVDVEKIDKLVNLVGELVITQAMIAAQIKDLSYDRFAGLINGVESLSHHTRELQDAVMSLRMQPVKTLFSRMPRIVRDLARKLDKDIKLELHGENTEVDKTIIQQLSDPLTHLIRNSADHGVETPAVRKANNKQPQGTIRLSADHRSGQIVISIIDDGAGINREKVLAKGRERGIVKSGENPTDEQIDMLIFAPGFSTADVVSDVSGRGVGMDVVKRNIESIGGFIEVFNYPGQGLIININIPLTLAIMDGMIVSVGQENYIVPINSILETLRPKSKDIKKIADGNDIIDYRGEFIQLLYLSKLFDIEEAQRDPEKGLVIIVETNQGKFGLVVDELLGQQQLVIKSLDQNSKAVDGISGATILGDGRVALILDMIKLQLLAHKVQLTNKNAA